MDFKKECFKEHDGDLNDQLKAAGFPEYRARQFWPEAATGILEPSQAACAGQMTKQIVSGGPSQFLGSVNVAVIAERLGMNSVQVKKGLAGITPVLAQELSQESDCLFGALTYLAPGLFKQLSQLSSKVFNFQTLYLSI